jgi:hypothetical protein
MTSIWQKSLAHASGLRADQLRREPQRRSTKAPRRRDQRDARLFKVG